MAALRPSEFNQRARAGLREQPEPLIELVGAADGGIDAYFVGPPPEASLPHADRQSAGRVRILNVQPELLTIYPINVRPDRADYLLPKYEDVTRIALSRPVKNPYDLPEEPEDVVDLLQGLPEGFGKQYQFGLGLLWEYRFIMETVAQVAGVTILLLHGERGSRDAKIDPPFYILGLQRFHELRKELARIASRYQREARSDKRLLAYNELLHSADRKQFPPKSKKLRSDAIADMTGIGASHTRLSKRDRRAVVTLVNENAEELAKAEPQALLNLKADIERVTLKELIDNFEERLAKSHTESVWQSFLQMNPFILSMAFSAPAMLVQANPYIGGTRFSRNGGKIADFLLATASTGNLAVIEIKRPQVELIAKKPYREDVYGLSTDLGGTVAQVLDQRFKLQKHIANLKDESGRHDIHTYAVRCIVIAGRSPPEAAHKKSLELARNALSDVMIVTFDELLGRLKEIHAALSPSPTPGAPSDNEVPF